MNKLAYDHIKRDERVNKMSEQNQIQFVVLNTLQRVWISQWMPILWTPILWKLISVINTAVYCIHLKTGKTLYLYLYIYRGIHIHTYIYQFDPLNSTFLLAEDCRAAVCTGRLMEQWEGLDIQPALTDTLHSVQTFINAVSHTNDSHHTQVTASLFSSCSLTPVCGGGSPCVRSASSHSPESATAAAWRAGGLTPALTIQGHH